jgi:predicted phosphodiesterase
LVLPDFIISHEPERAEDFLMDNQSDEILTFLIFGHTHIPYLEIRHNVIRINPCASGSSNLRTFPTIAVVRFENKQPHIEFYPI